MALYKNKIDKMYNDFDINGFLTKSLTGTTIDVNDALDSVLKELSLPSSINDMLTSAFNDMGLGSLLPNSDGVDIIKLILGDMESTLSGLGIGLKARNGLLSLTLETCFNFDINFDFGKFLKFNLIFRLGIEFTCGKNNTLKLLYDNEIKNRTRTQNEELQSLTTTVSSTYGIRDIKDRINIELQTIATTERTRRNELQEELQTLLTDPIKNRERIKTLMQELETLDTLIKVLEDNASSDTLTALREELARAEMANLANTPEDLLRINALMEETENIIKEIQSDYSTIILLSVQNVDYNNLLRLLNNLLEIDDIHDMLTPATINSIYNITNQVVLESNANETINDTIKLTPLDSLTTIKDVSLPTPTDKDKIMLINLLTTLLKFDDTYLINNIGKLSPTMRLAYLLYLNAHEDIGLTLPNKIFALLANNIQC